jgi:PAS domain S-box-containing protein
MSLANRLLLIVALAVLPALLVGVYAEYHARQEREAQVGLEAVRRADQVAVEMKQVTEVVQRVAMTLSYVPVVRTAAQSDAWSQPCSDLLAELRRDFPAGVGIAVANANAEIICAARPLPRGTLVSGAHFEQALERGRFTVGGYGQAPDGTGYLSFTYPITDGEGRSTGGIVLGLPLEWLSEQMSQRFGGADSSISIADRDLVYLVRLPEDPRRTIGEAAIPQHRALVEMAGKGAVEANGADGILRVGAIQAIKLDLSSTDEFDLIVGYGVSRDAAFAPVKQATRNWLLVLAASLVLASAAAWLGGRYLIRRPVERLVTAAEHFRDGDYTGRVPASRSQGEFGQLATAFNAMVESIASRNEQLQASEQRFRTLAELVPNFTWFADASGQLLYANQRWYDFSGQSPVEGMPVHWAEAVHPEDYERTLSTWSAAVATWTSFEAEFQVRRHDGVYHWVLGRAEPLRDDNGAVTGWFGSTTDIDKLKRADEHRSLLVDELNHRVKNTLATVQSLAAQSFRTADPKEARRTFEGRLITLSKTHDLLTEGFWKSANLREVAQEATDPFNGDSRIRISGPELEVTPRMALGVSMALHELLTNAIKHGSLSGPSGEVALRWKLAGKGTMLILTWEERGGPPVAPPRRKGFGMRLIENGLARELGGDVTVDFASQGLSCEFVLPLGGHDHRPATASGDVGARDDAPVCSSPTRFTTAT